jgi:anti-sigma factor RsiW
VIAQQAIKGVQMVGRRQLKVLGQPVPALDLPSSA